MAFYINEKQEIRLRFSRFAEEVLQNDMFFFREHRRNTFINTVIQNYYPTADASISLRLEEYKDHLINILNTFASKETLSLLLKAEQERLEKLANSYDKPGKECPNNPIRLQNSLYNYLTNEKNGTIENMFNDYTAPGYLRTLVEEYVRLPYKKRERIYFKEKYETIETALLTQKQLLVTISSGRQFHVLPYTIMEDPLGTAAYLVGFSYDKDSDKTNKKACSFRIATLQNDIRIENSKSGYLHPADKTLLKNKIAENGVQFLISDNASIKVKLTQQGIHSFNHQLNLRPTPTEINGDVYTFNCSIDQAKFYFFKFGKNVEMLEPEDLREYFSKGYLEAYEVYM